jgi:hypothetical protein
MAGLSSSRFITRGRFVCRNTILRLYPVIVEAVRLVTGDTAIIFSISIS